MKTHLPVQRNPRGTSLSRYVMALAGSRDLNEAIHRAESWIDTPAVHLALKDTVTAMDTTEPLAQYQIGDELIEALRGVSVFEQLKPLMRAVPFRTTVPIESSAATAGWTGEKGSKPCGAIAYGSSLSIPSYKSVVICVLSAELVRTSSPSAEAAVRSSLVRSVAAYLDDQFLDPSVALVAGVNPASVTNGGGSVVSTGDTANAIEADLEDMFGALGSWQEPRFIMRPGTASHIALAFRLPDIRRDGLFGVQVVVSTNSPQQIALIDVADVLVADDGRTGIKVAQEGDVLLTDGQSPEISGNVSLWQSDLVGVKVERYVSWLRAHATSSVVMPTAY